MVEVIKVIIPGPQGPAADVDLSPIESQLGVIDSRVAALESQGGQAGNDSGWIPLNGLGHLDNQMTTMFDSNLFADAAAKRVGDFVYVRVTIPFGVNVAHLVYLMPPAMALRVGGEAQMFQQEHHNVTVTGIPPIDGVSDNGAINISVHDTHTDTGVSNVVLVTYFTDTESMDLTHPDLSGFHIEYEAPEPSEPQ